MRAFGLSIFFLVAICGATAPVLSQNIDSLLAIRHAADPQEKMFVHFDKNYYNPGETIWFKAYIFQGLEPAKGSRNFYAELRDEKGVVIDAKNAPVIMSGATASFQLPDSFPRSAVYFRAYTANMLNSDTAFLFVKALKIIHPIKKTIARLPAAPAEIRFLPEGGDLVAGLTGNVAFAATGAGDKPVACQGIVKDGSGKQVAGFQSLHDGMGSFMLTPADGQTYSAVWKDEKGKEYTTPLPAVKNHGIVLAVTEGEGVKYYSLQRRADASAELQNLTVVALQNQQLVYEAKINLTAKQTIRTSIPVAELASGILQVTVFDNNMRPVAERICFVNNSNYEFDADAWLSDLNPVKRGLNRGEVKIADTVAANFSVSVTDADLDVPEPGHDNIVSHMLLTGDLRGKIYDPYYYFFSTSDSVGYHLDLVMLTHGWRRYNWPDLLSGKTTAPRFTETDYLSLTGKVIGSQGGAFEPGLALNGFFKTSDSANNFISFPIDRKGNISAPGMLFYDTAKLYLQFSDKNRQFEPSMLSLGTGLIEPGQVPPPLALSRFIPYDPDTLIANGNLDNNLVQLKMAAKKYKDAKMLENVTVTAKAKTAIEKLEQQYVGGLFTGDGKGFDVINDKSAISSFSVFQYLQGKVAGLQITASGATPSLSWRGGSPAIYLNEMQTDVSQVASLSMSDIAYIKVLSPGSAGAVANSGNGVISIYTRKGGDVQKSDDSKIGVVRIMGYSGVKQFSFPDYANPETDTFYDDRRTTLYWNPFVMLDKTKKRFKFQFYNNDITSRFRIVLEGINDEGKLVHVEKVVSKN